MTSEGLPVYASPSARIKAQEASERELAIANEKEKKRLKKLGQNFELKDKDGIPKIYNYSGKLVSESEYEPPPKVQVKRTPPAPVGFHFGN
jgi:hypothetical protein